MKNPDYSHGPLIPIISIYILFRKKDTIINADKKGQNSGLYLIFFGLFLEIFSLRTQVNFLSSYSLIIVITGVVLFLWGRKILSASLFPIMYLFFMVPFWGLLTDKFSNLLKTLAANFSYILIQIMGYPILKEGVILHLSNGTLEVADPCSGLRSLISLMALGTLFSYFSNGHIIKKIILVFSTIPVAFIANVIRIILFALILEHKGIYISEGPLHSLTGLGIFIIAFIFLIINKKLLKI